MDGTLQTRTLAPATEDFWVGMQLPQIFAEDYCLMALCLERNSVFEIISSGHCKSLIFSPRIIDDLTSVQPDTILSLNTFTKHYSLLLDPAIQRYASRFTSTGSRSLKYTEEDKRVRQQLAHDLLSDDLVIDTVAGGGPGAGVEFQQNEAGDDFVIMGQQRHKAVPMNEEAMNNIIKWDDKGKWSWNAGYKDELVRQCKLHNLSVCCHRPPARKLTLS
jgi:hypothetical protein